MDYVGEDGHVYLMLQRIHSPLAQGVHNLLLRLEKRTDIETDYLRRADPTLMRYDWWFMMRREAEFFAEQRERERRGGGE